MSTKLPRTASGKLKFPEISQLAFQHPADREALEAVKQVPFAPMVLRKINELWTEKLFYVKTIGDNLKIGPNQYKKLYEMFREAADILDMPVLPDIYLDTAYEVNAFAFGAKKYTLVMNSGLVDLLDDEEIMAVIGHELGHVKCEHVLYKNLAATLANFGTDILTSFFGVTNLIMLPIKAALFAWSRKAELSCDRAALLVTQNAEVSARALAKLGGAGLRTRAEPVNMEEVLKQASEYERLDDSIVLKGMQLWQSWDRSHPYPIYRAKVLMQWAESEEYKKILAGEYMTHAQAAAHRHGHGPEGATKCHKCGMGFSRAMAFCPGCGARLQQQMMTAQCNWCRQPVDPSWAVCTACGKSQREAPQACACGAQIKPGWRFCQKCGAPSPGANPPAPPQ